MIGMSVTAATYDLTGMQRRADYEITLQFQNLDLTGWTVAAQVWDAGRTIKHANFDVSYVSRPSGIVSMSLTDTQTALLPSTSRYDVLLVNPLGLREYYLEGVVYISEGYTEV